MRGHPSSVLVAVTALFGAPMPPTGRAAINMGTRPLVPGPTLAARPCCGEPLCNKSERGKPDGFPRTFHFGT